MEIKGEIQRLKSALDQIKQSEESVEAALKGIKSLQSEALTVNENLSQLIKDHSAALIEQEVLIKKFNEIGDQGRVKEVLANIEAVLKSLGYTLEMTSNSDNTRTYKFDYGADRFIRMHCDDQTKFSLLEVSPAHVGFTAIKDFADESQDIMGLLVNFSRYFDLSNC